MKVPLTLNLNDQQGRLDICTNGVHNYVDLPHKPFIFAQRDAFPEVSSKNIYKFTVIPSHEVKDFYKLQFNTNSDLRDFYQNAKLTYRDRYIWQQPYNEALFMTDEDFVLKYPNTNDLVVMYWDIETRTIGDHKFSKPSKDPVLCAGYSIWHYKHDGSKVKVKQEIIDCYVDDNKIMDTQILGELVTAIHGNNVDVLAGYNSEFFDFPFFYTRCKVQKVDMSLLGRNGREPYIGRDDKIYILSLIHI